MPQYHPNGELVLNNPKDDLFTERPIWHLTQHRRIHTEQPANRFAALLYALIKVDPNPVKEVLNQDWAQKAYQDIADLEHGSEMSRSFALFRDLLNQDDMRWLSQLRTQLDDLPAPEQALRPATIQALHTLAAAGADVGIFLHASSKTNRLSAITRATEALEQLQSFVKAEVNDADGRALLEIIEHWQPLLVKAGGALGRAQTLKPVVNPYVAGDPVTGDLFVGRDDIMRRLEELWADARHAPSVVLYGHRRMGKTSILQNLGARLPGRYRLVDFNMQRMFAESTAELLYELALACYQALSSHAECDTSALAAPEDSAFFQRSPYRAFDHYLRSLDAVCGEWHLLVLVDEFEVVETEIQAGVLEAKLLTFWRGMIQGYPWFSMVFAGLHTLQEMREDYWHPFFGSVTSIPVSFLDDADARQLLVQPEPDFDMDYEPEAVAEALALTHGQPYLLQLIGHSLVSRFNRQTFAQEAEPPRVFGLADVQAVIDNEAFFRDGDAYFTGVWGQADEPQQAVLRWLAANTEGMSLAAMEPHLADVDIPAALESLQHHDVLHEQNGRWCFTVELMRRWVAAVKLRQVY